MAQYKKDEVRQAVLAAAKREFLKHGFAGANIRAIARRAGQKPGNIYNYFENKDGLFRAVLEKTLETIHNAIEYVQNWQPTEDHPVYSLEEEREALMAVIHFIDANRDDVRLLMFKSAGSSLENLQEHAVEEMAVIFDVLFKRVLEITGMPLQRKPSRFFMHNLLLFFFNAFKGMLQKNMSLEEMEVMTNEMLSFYYPGIMAMLEGREI